MDNTLIITPYAEFKHLDVSKIKIKEPNHLFDIDPIQRNPYKRAPVDTQEMTPISVTECFSFDNAIFSLFYFSQWMFKLRYY